MMFRLNFLKIKILLKKMNGKNFTNYPKILLLKKMKVLKKQELEPD